MSNKLPTYRDLRDAINKLPEEHLDDNVTVYVSHEDEFFMADGIHVQDEDDIIEAGCLYLTTATEEDIEYDDDDDDYDDT